MAAADAEMEPQLSVSMETPVCAKLTSGKSGECARGVFVMTEKKW